MSEQEIDLKIQPDSSPLDAWQIGSSGPPAMCLCCGQRFDEGEHKIHGPYLEMPYIWVCDWCHKKPYLFFPDKPVAPYDPVFQYQLDGKNIAERQTARIQSKKKGYHIEIKKAKPEAAPQSKLPEATASDSVGDTK